MNRLFKKSLIVAAVVATAGASWYGLKVAKGDGPEAISTDVLPIKIEPILVQDAEKKAEKLDPVGISKSSLNAMLDEYYRKRSGRAFVSYAIQHPELGGVFYARNLLRKCALIRFGDNGQLQGVQIAVDADLNGLTHVQRTDSIRFLQGKCSDFTDAELDVPDALVKNHSGRDVLEKASSGLYESQLKKNVDEINISIKDIIDRADPVLIDNIGIKILSPGFYKSMTAHFMGSQYLISSEVVNAAIYLLPCEIGLRCTNDEDLVLALQCASGRSCFKSRSDHALVEMVGGNAQRYSEAEQLAKEMALAIRQNNIAAFMPKL